MKVIMDTNSLLSLVRYYLPFDAKEKLIDFFKAKIESGEVLIIDAVYDECEKVSQRLILKELSFLTKSEFKKKYRKTNELVPREKFYNLLDNQFRTRHSRRLSEAEFENQKEEFLKSADARMIILALKLLNEPNLFNDNVVIITEETRSENDNKTFRKIPAICDLLDIQVQTLPEWIKKTEGINVLIN